MAEKLNGDGQCFKNLIYESNATPNKIATDWFSEFHNLTYWLIETANLESNGILILVVRLWQRDRHTDQEKETENPAM